MSEDQPKGVRASFRLHVLKCCLCEKINPALDRTGVEVGRVIIKKTGQNREKPVDPIQAVLAELIVKVGVERWQTGGGAPDARQHSLELLV